LSTRGFAAVLVSSLFILTVISPFVFEGNGGDARAWTDGNRDSPVRPNYGIRDMIAHKALMLLNDSDPQKASFLMYWFKEDGPDDDPESYDPDHLYPLSDDNFLAWTDDGPEGVTVDYFINNPEPGQDPQTDAVQYAQLLANRTLANLTRWFLAGGGSDDREEITYMHAAAYNAGKLAKYVGDMSQYGHTDYSKWDQLSVVPGYHPSEVKYPYREYYEARVWNDENMETLFEEFWNNRTFSPPGGFHADTVHLHTSDLAKWVNGRGQPPVQIQDYDNETITVGFNYNRMLSAFMYCWDTGLEYNGVRGFNATLWELTLENLVASAETLVSIYEALYDEAWQEFLLRSPELRMVNWSVHPDPVIAGDLVTVNATIRNDGRMVAENFKMLINGPGGFTDWKGLTLEPGEEKNVSFYPFQVNGDPVSFTVTIDYEDAVAESDETNNIFNGTITPIPEVHTSRLELLSPFPSIRRDTQKTVSIGIRNTGNRMDSFHLGSGSATSGLTVTLPEGSYLIKPGTLRPIPVLIATTNETPLGNAEIELNAVGGNSTASFMLEFTILERTHDPVPVITGFSWGRANENITLSALDSYDVDGDSLSFRWVIPLYANTTAPVITVNYTKVGTYEIRLTVFDGNATATLLWPLRIYPNVPDNISAEVAQRGISGITVSFKPWNAGGLIAYWVEAAALPDQGERSGRGPYLVRIGPGNSSARVGRFLPGTDVEIKITVEAERFGNVTTDILTTSTTSISAFEENLKLDVEDWYLYIKYKPWMEPEGRRDPDLVVERFYKGEYIPMDTPLEIIQKTSFKDTLRYPLGSNWGKYRASLTYYWAEESISPFSLYVEIERENRAPVLNMSGTDREFMLNINGTCKVWFVLGVDDPEDTMEITIEWGDGYVENMTLHVPSSRMEFQSLFHNYTDIGDYTVSVKVEDWSGEVSSYNTTITISEYRETSAGKSEERSVWTLVGLIALGILIVIVLVIFGYIGYKFSKKDTEVEFKMKDFKSEIEKQKAGTGTDFDKRRVMQIPKESILIRPETVKEEGGSDEELPMISGKVSFDDEE